MVSNPSTSVKYDRAASTSRHGSTGIATRITIPSPFHHLTDPAELSAMPTVGPGRTNLGFAAFDMLFVQRFSNGDAAPMAADAFWAVFGPHVERPEPEVDFWRVRAADGGEADIHAGVAGPSLDSLMISRFSMGTVLELLVEFVRQAGAVIMPPGCPTLVIDQEQAMELPAELRADVAVVSRVTEWAPPRTPRCSPSPRRPCRWA
jgi:hypothetical protein